MAGPQQSKEKAGNAALDSATKNAATESASLPPNRHSAMQLDPSPQTTRAELARLAEGLARLGARSSLGSQLDIERRLLGGSVSAPTDTQTGVQTSPSNRLAETLKNLQRQTEKA